ncbi:MAG: DHA2 family efflux MFS transporter permease subunit [Chlamydiia bacterium]|nr:DHA2 family efflux MFS transporter permease subunit [Chlamydiia bacterium]
MSVIQVSRIRLIVLTFSISLGTLLISLDQFIANVSIPTISGVLGISQNNGAWVITSFTIASAISLPLVGWLSSLFGQRNVFCMSCLLFSVASFLCGLANSFTLLLTFRVFQGLVSGALIPLSQTLLLLLYPSEKKGLAMGLWGLVVMGGPTVAPLIGGWITENYGWEWIFYINVPIGTFAGLVTFFVLSPWESMKKNIPIDVVGILLIVMAVVSFQVMLDKGQDLDWWNSYFIRILVIAAIFCFCLFIPWELFKKNPLLDLSFFKSRNFTLASIMISVAMLVIFGSCIVFPIWVQAQLGYTPFWSGLTLAPFGFLAIFLFPMMGIVQQVIDRRIWIAMGFLIFAGTFFWYSKLNPYVTYWDISLPRLLQGAGFAFLYVPLTTIAFTGIPSERLHHAATLFSFVRILFLSFGISLSVTFWERRESFYQSRFVEYMIPSNPAFVPYFERLRVLGLEGKTAAAFADQMVNIQAFTMSLLDLSLLASYICIGMMVLLFFFRSPKKAQGLAFKFEK